MGGPLFYLDELLAMLQCSNQLEVRHLSRAVGKGDAVFNLRKWNDRFEVLKTLQTSDGPSKLQDAMRGFGSKPREGSANRLNETRDFGANPGQLRMFSFLPPHTVERPALVVVLHGCGQTAAGYDHGAGWSTLAERFGFALLVPEQQRANNPNGCFNWFQPEDSRRGHGEPASIHQMIQTMVREKHIDPNRVFVTGLSAGGAMTSVMLACYPETFAAGAVIAGLPYGAASNVQEAFQTMARCPSRPAKDWGDLVRAAAPKQRANWPRVSVWHGDADKTVTSSNAREIIKQWTDVHGLSGVSPKEETVADYPRHVWLNEAGEEIVEFYDITHMAHGTPLATGNADFECGAAGPFLLEVGISSSFHIAKFFALTPSGVRRDASASSKQRTERELTLLPSLTEVETLEGEVLEGPTGQYIRPNSIPRRIDIGTVIGAALEKAGLMTRR